MTIPHYINEGGSEMRGIKPGWYVMERSGPFSSYEEWLSRSTQPTHESQSRPSQLRSRLS
jgi:hypothetical protein